MLNVLTYKKNLPYKNRILPYENRNLPYENRNLPYKNRNLPFKNRNLPYENRNLPYENRNLPYENRNLPYKNRILPYENRNLPYKNRILPYENRNLLHCWFFYAYNRFVELQKKSIIPLAIFLKTCALGSCTGVSFIDSTPLRVCHIKREKQHKTFKNIALKGQCSLGWFFGFKLHLIINDKGEILDFIITQANVDDRKPLEEMGLHKNIFGKLYGDKGYIGKDLFEKLFVDGVHLITKIRKNMKNCLMLMQDKIALRKRALIETVNDELKNMCQIEHTRHRSFDNFITNLLSGLIAYSFFPKKPSINLNEDIIDLKRVAA